MCFNWVSSGWFSSLEVPLNGVVVNFLTCSNGPRCRRIGVVWQCLQLVNTLLLLLFERVIAMRLVVNCESKRAGTVSELVNGRLKVDRSTGRNDLGLGLMTNLRRLALSILVMVCVHGDLLQVGLWNLTVKAEMGLLRR